MVSGVTIGVNTATDTLTFGLDGSIGAGAASSITSQENQDNVDYPMSFLSDVGVGASVYTDSTPDESFTYNPSSGTLKSKQFDALSDARLKTDIVDIEDALGKVTKLRGVEYDWKKWFRFFCRHYCSRSTGSLSAIGY